jgi:hypothetical protein
LIGKVTAADRCLEKATGVKGRPLRKIILVVRAALVLVHFEAAT